MALLMVVSFIPLAYLHDSTGRFLGVPITSWLLLAFGLPIAVVAALGLLVALSTPKTIVPPHLRDEQGLVSDWIDRRRDRRRRKPPS
jgi:uncharacterized protein (DUF58 family)